MANYFAIKSGNWDDTTVWDSGIIPTSADVVYTNGFVVTVNSDLDVQQLRTGSNSGQLANMCIPVMTSNTTPSGVASASVNPTTAFYAFGRQGGTYSVTAGISAFTLSYDFGAGNAKIINRFRLFSLYNQCPNAFTFQWSDDNINWTTLWTGNGVNTSPNSITISALLGNTVAHRYYRINVTSVYNTGFATVIYALDMTESSAVTNGSNATPTATGGNYLVSALPTAPSTRTITVRDATSGIVNTSAVNAFQITAPSGIININHATLGNIVGGSALVASQFNIYATGTAACTININGNLFGDTVTSGGAARSNAAFGTIGGITANIIGTLTAGNMYFDGNANFGSCAVYVGTGAGNAVVNVTGNLFGQSASLGGAGSDAIYLIGNNATLTLVGNVTANLFYGIRTWTTYTGNINITTGTVTASASYFGIFNQGSGIVTLSSPIINTNNTMGVYSARIRLYSTAQVQWLFQNSAGTNTTLYSAGASLGLPLTTNVRYPVQYGASNELTGQLVMPLPSNVRVGVPTDNTVGTGQLTAADFLAAIAVSSDPVAERLRTVSTVDTTGDQIAAFNV